MSNYHIKRDGAWLCKLDIQWPKLFIKLDGAISFSQAHKVNLEYCCPDCRKKYYDIISKLKTPIIIK